MGARPLLTIVDRDGSVIKTHTTDDVVNDCAIVVTRDDGAQVLIDASFGGSRCLIGSGSFDDGLADAVAEALRPYELPEAKRTLTEFLDALDRFEAAARDAMALTNLGGASPPAAVTPEPVVGAAAGRQATGNGQPHSAGSGPSTSEVPA